MSIKSAFLTSHCSWMSCWRHPSPGILHDTPRSARSRMSPESATRSQLTRTRCVTYFDLEPVKTAYVYYSQTSYQRRRTSRMSCTTHRDQDWYRFVCMALTNARGWWMLGKASVPTGSIETIAHARENCNILSYLSRVTYRALIPFSSSSIHPLWATKLDSDHCLL